MTKLAAGIHSRLHSDKGATAVEYGLMVALIAAVIVVAVTALGDRGQRRPSDRRHRDPLIGSATGCAPSRGGSAPARQL